MKSVVVTTLWWLVLYAWLAHGVRGAYNLLVAGAVLNVVLFLSIPMMTAKPSQARPPLLRGFNVASSGLYTLALIWCGHGWLAAASAMGMFAGAFHQHLCGKAAGQGG